MHYPKVLKRVDFPEQIFHRSFSLGAPDNPAYDFKVLPCSLFWSHVTSENFQLPDSTLSYGPTNSPKHHQPLSLLGFAGGKLTSLQM